jgi:hypothetical protein
MPHQSVTTAPETTNEVTMASLEQAGESELPNIKQMIVEQ